MSDRLRVSAVSYLNTAPLVWGLSQGPQRGLFDLRFSLPSECADALRAGEADIGLVPAIELARQPDLLVLPGCSISCRGAVRSVLLISLKPIETIESFAADTSSRTSVALAQVLLARKYGLRPRVRPYPPKIDDMLEVADAGLIIGDPALRLDPEQTDWRGRPIFVYDLGLEWVDLTGLPMVFAVWAVKNLAANPDLPVHFVDSADYGRQHIDEIIATESEKRDLLARTGAPLSEGAHELRSRRAGAAKSCHIPSLGRGARHRRTAPRACLLGRARRRRAGVR